MVAHVTADPICTSVVRIVVVPSPSVPWPFCPAHHRVPSVRVAHVWYPPAATLDHVVGDAIGMGKYGVPFVWTAHVSSTAAPIVCHVAEPICTGTIRCVVV